MKAHTDPRQSQGWGKYMQSINWQVLSIKGRQIFIRKVPFLGFSVIKIQRPKNPLPFTEIDLIAKKHRALFVNLEPHFDQHNEIVLKKHGFNLSNMILSHTSTILIDLTQSEKQIWGSLSENARRNIKKVQSAECRVQSVYMKDQKDDTEFKKFFELLKNLSQYRKFYIPKYPEFLNKMLAFKTTSVLLFAYPSTNHMPATRKPDNLTPIAAIWLAGYDDIIFYVQTGITNQGYKSLANYLLVWEGLKLAKKLGYKTWDFEGIFDPRFPKEREKWQGFSEFKQRFHGQIIHYPPSYIKIYNPFFQVIYWLSKILP